MDIDTPTTHRSVQKHQPLLGYFVLASVVLHALLVGLWQGEAPAGPSAHSTFQVTLLARHGDAASRPGVTDQTIPAHTPNTATGSADSASTTDLATVEGALHLTASVAARQATRLQPAAKTSSNKLSKRESRTEATTRESAINETPSSAQQKQISARNGSTSHGQHELTSAAKHRKIRNALQEALLPRFDYPPLARRRGWQGRVNVGLHVEADGDLTRIHLVKSSGHVLLDRAAVRNITELRSIPRATQWLEGNGIDMVLPVRYQLAD
jgi:protein TonB